MENSINSESNNKGDLENQNEKDNDINYLKDVDLKISHPSTNITCSKIPPPASILPPLSHHNSVSNDSKLKKPSLLPSATDAKQGNGTYSVRNSSIRVPGQHKKIVNRRLSTSGVPQNNYYTVASGIGGGHLPVMYRAIRTKPYVDLKSLNDSQRPASQQYSYPNTNEFEVQSTEDMNTNSTQRASSSLGFNHASERVDENGPITPSKLVKFAVNAAEKIGRGSLSTAAVVGSGIVGALGLRIPCQTDSEGVNIEDKPDIGDVTNEEISIGKSQKSMLPLMQNKTLRTNIKEKTFNNINGMDVDTFAGAFPAKRKNSSIKLNFNKRSRTSSATKSATAIFNNSLDKTENSNSYQENNKDLLKDNSNKLCKSTSNDSIQSIEKMYSSDQDASFLDACSKDDELSIDPDLSASSFHDLDVEFSKSLIPSITDEIQEQMRHSAEVKEQRFEEFKTELFEKDEELLALRDEVTAKSKALMETASQNDTLESNVRKLDKQCQILNNEVQHLSQNLKNKETVIAKLLMDIEMRDADLDDIENDTEQKEYINSMRIDLDSTKKENEILNHKKLELELELARRDEITILVQQKLDKSVTQSMALSDKVNSEQHENSQLRAKIISNSEEYDNNEMKLRNTFIEKIKECENSYKSSLESLKAELEDLKNEKIKINSGLVIAEQARDNLARRLAEADLVQEDLNSKLSIAASTNDILPENVNATIAQAIEDLKSQVASLKENNLSLKIQNADLEKEVSSRNDIITNNTRDIECLIFNSKLKDLDNVKLQQELQDVKVVSIASGEVSARLLSDRIIMENTINSLNNEKSLGQAMIVNYGKKIDALENTITELNSEKKSLEISTENIMNKKKEIELGFDNSEKEIRSLEGRISQLIEEKHQLSSQMDALEVEKLGNETKVRDLESMIGQENSHHKEYSSQLEFKIKDCEEKICKLEKDIILKETSITEIEMIYKSKLDALSQEHKTNISEIQGRFTDLESQKDMAVKELAETIKKIDESTHDFGLLETDAKERKARCEKLESQVSELQTKLQVLEKQKDTLSSTNDGSEKTINKLMEEKSCLNNKIVSILEELKCSNKNVDELKLELSQLKQINLQLQDKIVNSTEDSESQISILKDAIIQKESEINSLYQDIENFRDEVKESDRLHKEEIENMKISLNCEMNVLSNQFEEKIKDKENEIISLSEKLELTMKRLNEGTDESSRLENKFLESKRHYEESKLLIESLLKDINSKENAISNLSLEKEKFENELKILENEKVELDSRLSEATCLLEEERTHRTEKLRELEMALANNEGTIENLTSKLQLESALVSDLTKEKGEKEDCIKDIVLEKETLEKRINSLESLLESTHQELKEKLAEYSEHISKKDLIISELKSELNDADLKTKMKIVNKDNVIENMALEHRKELDIIKEEYENSVNGSNKLRNKLEKEIESLRNSCKELNNAIELKDKAYKAIASNNEDVSIISNELEKLKSELHASITKIQELENEKSELSGQLLQEQSLNEGFTDKFILLSKERNDFEATLSKRTSQLKRLRQAYEELKGAGSKPPSVSPSIKPTTTEALHERVTSEPSKKSSIPISPSKGKFSSLSPGSMKSFLRKKPFNPDDDSGFNNLDYTAETNGDHRRATLTHTPAVMPIKKLFRPSLIVPATSSNTAVSNSQIAPSADSVGREDRIQMKRSGNNRSQNKEPSECKQQ